jgi:uncharacterized protein (DUF2344 family)
MVEEQAKSLKVLRRLKTALEQKIKKATTQLKRQNTVQKNTISKEKKAAAQKLFQDLEKKISSWVDESADLAKKIDELQLGTHLKTFMVLLILSMQEQDLDQMSELDWIGELDKMIVSTIVD